MYLYQFAYNLTKPSKLLKHKQNTAHVEATSFEYIFYVKFITIQIHKSKLFARIL